ncbi:MAG: hypothetical protein OEZ34_12480 [Spirochaetia bacterium]|nr:hypothetical protein [Spirochaetia bacterium]
MSKKIQIFFSKNCNLSALVVLTAGIYYVYHLRHHSVWMILIFSLPVVIFNYFIFLVLINRLKKILFHLKIFNLRTEIFIIIVLFPVLIFFLFDLFLYIAILYLWIALQLVQKKKDLFLIGYAGLILFSCIFLSRIFLVQEERAFFLIRAYALQFRHRGEEVSWKKDSSGIIVLRRGQPYLHIKIPEEMYFHGPEKKRPGFDYPEPGIPVGMISSSELHQETAPAMWIFESEAKAEDLSVFQSEFKMFLGYRKEIGEISNIVFEGRKEIEISGNSLNGIFWIYKENAGARKRTGLYILKRNNYSLIFLLHDLPVDGFPHHPALLQLLYGLQF